MRNSSLVEESCTEDVMGLEFTTDTATFMIFHGGVGERCQSIEAMYVSNSGVLGSENAGMSSDNLGENPRHRKPKVSYATLISVG